MNVLRGIAFAEAGVKVDLLSGGRNREGRDRGRELLGVRVGRVKREELGRNV